MSAAPNSPVGSPVASPAGSQKELRRLNRNRVFRALFTAGKEITRQDICERTGLNPPLVSRVTAEMIASGLLEETCPAMEHDRRGRRRTLLRLRPEGAYVIAVAITAYSQEILLGNLKGHIIHSKTIPDFFALNQEDLVPFLAEAMRQTLKAAGIARERLVGGSMALPRQVLLQGDKTTGVPLLGGALPDGLAEALGMPLIPIRLAEALNLAENIWGASRGFANVLYLHLTHIIGASLIHGNALLPPPDSIGNIAGLPVARAGVSTSGLARIENTASGMSVLRRLGHLPETAMLSRYTIEDSLNLSLAHAQSLAGDRPAQAAFTEAGEWMGHALETLYHAYRPDVIIFGGSLTDNPFYYNAMLNEWRSLHQSGTPVETRNGTLSVGSAAILTALQLHIASRELDLEPLLADRTTPEGGADGQPGGAARKARASQR